MVRRVVSGRRRVLMVGGKVSVGPPKGKEQGGKERDVPLSGEIGLRLAAHLAEFQPVPVGLPRQGSGREAADSEPAVQQVRRQGDQSPQLELRCLEARAASV